MTDEFRKSIFKRAHGRCEKCSVHNYTVIRYPKSGGSEQLKDEGEGSFIQARNVADYQNGNSGYVDWKFVVLNICFLDKDEKNVDPNNLIVLCQRCSSEQDKAFKQSKNKSKKNINELF